MDTDGHRWGGRGRGDETTWPSGVATAAFAAACLLCGGFACEGDGGEADTHEVVNGVRQLPAAELHEWLAGDPGLHVVDVRILYDWRHGHLPGASCVPGAAVMDHVTGELVDGGSALTDVVPDLRARIAFYCSGSECDVSQAVAEAALRIGYTDVWKLVLGYPGWVAAGYEAAVTVEDYCSVPFFPPAAGDEAVDVRTAAAFSSGAIPGAVNVPRASFLDAAGVPIDGGAAFTGAVASDAGIDWILASDDAELRAVGRFASGAGYRNVRLLEGTFVDWLATSCGSAAP
ncbi:MAG: hypothetical protein HY905_18115 [Deltaproteobacteria bacterium]|nr:hypothetical protein [Deltaproteobacteria bacterium]